MPRNKKSPRQMALPRRSNRSEPARTACPTTHHSLTRHSPVPLELHDHIDRGNPLMVGRAGVIRGHAVQVLAAEPVIANLRTDLNVRVRVIVQPGGDVVKVPGKAADRGEVAVW